LEKTNKQKKTKQKKKPSVICDQRLSGQKGYFHPQRVPDGNNVEHDVLCGLDGQLMLCSLQSHIRALDGNEHTIDIYIFITLYLK